MRGRVSQHSGEFPLFVRRASGQEAGTGPQELSGEMQKNEPFGFELIQLFDMSTISRFSETHQTMMRALACPKPARVTTSSFVCRL